MTDRYEHAKVLLLQAEGILRDLEESDKANAVWRAWQIVCDITPIMANGLTEAETSATPSCSGLTVKPMTPWVGGECPVAFTKQVEYKLSGEGEERFFSRAGILDWLHHGGRDDIVAYRVL